MTAAASPRPIDTAEPLPGGAWALVTPEPSEAELIALRSALAEILRDADRDARSSHA